MGASGVHKCWGACCCCYALRGRPCPQVCSAGAVAGLLRLLNCARHAAAVCSWSASSCTTSSLQQLDMLGAPCCRLSRAAAGYSCTCNAAVQGCRGSRVAPTSQTMRSSRPRAVSTLLSWAGAPAKRTHGRAEFLCSPSPCHRRNAQGAVLVSPHATGARFTMYLLNLGARRKPGAAC